MWRVNDKPAHKASVEGERVVRKVQGKEREGRVGVRIERGAKGKMDGRRGKERRKEEEDKESNEFAIHRAEGPETLLAHSR